MFRTCEKPGGVNLAPCVGKLGWVKWGVLELACPTVYACHFKVRPGVLSKTLSHMWGKLNLLIFLFNVGPGVLNKTPSHMWG